MRENYIDRETSNCYVSLYIYQSSFDKELHVCIQDNHIMDC